MHPGFIRYWRRRHGGDAWVGATAGCWEGASRADAWHGRSRHRATGRRHRGDDVFGAGSMGMRRPLRHLAYHLDLDPSQVSKLARILEQVKVEREQAAVDLRRAAGDLADALEGAELADDKLAAAGERRLEAARRVQETVSEAVRALHALLDEEQREDLADLIRTGGLRL